MVAPVDVDETSIPRAGPARHEGLVGLVEQGVGGAIDERAQRPSRVARVAPGVVSARHVSAPRIAYSIRCALLRTMLCAKRKPAGVSSPKKNRRTGSM